MTFPANIDLSGLDGSTGFKLSGVAAHDYSGWSVASADDADTLVLNAPGVGLVASFAPTVVNAGNAATASNPGTAGYFIFDIAGTAKGTLYWDATGGCGVDAVAVARLPGVTSSQRATSRSCSDQRIVDRVG